jgi:hypothetical protein
MSPPLTERAVNLPSNHSPPKSNSESPVKMMNLNQVPGLGQGQGQVQGQGQGQRGIQNSESIDSFQDSQPILASLPGIQESPRQVEGMQQQQQQQSQQYPQQIQQQPQQPQQQQMQQQQQQQPQFQQLQQQPEPVDLAPPIRPPPQQQQQQVNGSQPNGPPQRPRREGDEEYRRAMSPPNGPPSPTNPTHRVVSPTNAKNGFNSSILGTRSPSPRMRMADGDSKPVPPADAFYYGRSPTANGFSPQVRPNSLHRSGSSELMSQLKSRDAELEAGRKREAGLRVILGKAMQAGFVADVDDEDGSEHGDVDGDEDLVGKLTDALVRLKHEKASIQVSS